MNLPVAQPDLTGRDCESAAAPELLRNCDICLYTLTGSGGWYDTISAKRSHSTAIFEMELETHFTSLASSRARHCLGTQNPR